MSYELTIKGGSLGDEIRRIRKRELKVKARARKLESLGKASDHKRSEFYSLREHRLGLRPLARSTNLAQGYLRGRTYHQIENKAYSEPDWDEVARMVTKYGHRDSRRELQSFEEWRQSA